MAALNDGFHKIFIDTSALLAVFDASDQWHNAAAKYWTSELIDATERPKVYISDYILDEAATRIREKAGHKKAVAALDLLRMLIASGAITMARIEAHRFDSAVGIFRKCDGQDFSFTDCTSFAVCSELEISRAFAFDTHFRAYGIQIAPVYPNVPTPF